MSEQLVTPENVTTKDGKINLLDLNRQQMREFFKDLGEKPFRADQVMKWMYHYCCDNFDEMTDINKVLRGKLKEVAEIRAPEVVEEQRSSDGTIKWAIAVGDQRVETVYIPEDDRATLCVSSQVVPHQQRPQAGSTLWLHLPQESLHLFDSETGQRA